MSTRPKIAVTGSYRRGWPMWIANRLSLAIVGGRGVRITPREGQTVAWEEFDGLVIGGGDDISAQLYGGSPELDIRIDPARDALELYALEAFLPTERPVLGICRGAQILNAALGGSLYADVGSVYRDTRNMRTALPLKTMSIATDTALFGIMQRECVRVNSLHHQSVDRLGRSLRIAAEDRYGMVQAIECVGAKAFRIGVQWHPEFLIYHSAHRAIFSALVKAAREVVGEVGAGAPADAAPPSRFGRDYNSIRSPKRDGINGFL